MNQDPANERQTLQAMLGLLDERGLGFEEALAGTQDPSKERAVLELQTTLQTEIELLRRKLNKEDPLAPNLVLLGQVRTALDRHELGAFVRSSARKLPAEPSDTALLLAELESRVRQTLQSRQRKLEKL